MGKSIRIYLADGSVSGVRHAEIVNWSGQALAVSRNNLSELIQWPEVRRQGVYFLIGVDSQTDQGRVYIGEAESVAERIPQHIGTKDFWHECVAFTSKDENLTKSHVKYLEARLVGVARLAGRYIVENHTTPQESGLPRADRDAMDEFAANVRTVLGVLGHRVLEPLLSTRGTSAPPTEASTVSARSNTTARVTDLYLRLGGIEARAVLEDDELIVLEGSSAASEVAQSLSLGYRAIRDKLVSAEILVPDEYSQLKFSRNHPFPSPSQAAAIIVGYMINGRQAWKSENGEALGDLEDARAKELEARLVSDTDAR
jgi:hypothetical protein